MTHPDQPASGRKLRLRSLDDVKILPTRYLWTDYLPVAELAMLVGKPGGGEVHGGRRRRRPAHDR